MKKCISLMIVFVLIFSNFYVKADNQTPPAISSINLNFTPNDSEINPTLPVIYIVDKTNYRLHEYNYETMAHREVIFDMPPERICYANGKIYVALEKTASTAGGAFAVVDCAAFNKVSQFSISIDPSDIAADNNGFVYLSSSIIHSYNATTGAYISSSSGYSSSSSYSYIEYSPTLSKIYAVCTGVSPSDVVSYTVSSSGVVSNYHDSPYHGDYSCSGRIRITPNGKYLFNYSSIYNSSTDNTKDLTYVRDFPTFSDIAFDTANDRLFASSNNSNVINIFSTEYMKKTGSLNTVGIPFSIHSRSDRLIAVTSNSTSQYAIENIPFSNITPYIPDEAVSGINLNALISETVYDKERNKACSIDSNFGHLFITDLTNKKVDKIVKLPYNPLGVCFSEDGTKVYTANNSNTVPVTEIEVATGNILRNLTYNVNADYTYGSYRITNLHRHVFQRGGLLYFINAEFDPKVYVFNANTFAFVSSPFASVGDLAFNSNNSKLYFWYQNGGWKSYGSTPGSNVSALHQYSISNNVFTKTGQTNVDIVRDPIDTPIIVLEDKDLIICKKHMFKLSDLNTVIGTFYEPIYAANPIDNTAIGKTGIYDLNTRVKIADFTNTKAKSFFYNKDGILYYEANGVLVSSELSKIQLNTSSLNMDVNDTYQLSATANYSDGISNVVTSAATYSSNKPEVVSVNESGYITAKGIGNAEITVSYGGISSKVNVSVGVQLSSITLSQGTLSPTFDPNKGDYTVILPFGTKTVPTITAVAKQTACTVTITLPESLPGTAEITVVSPDNSAQSKYTVYMETEEFLQSSHPYANSMNKTWTYTEPDLVSKLQITFSSETAVENYCDNIYITDGSGKNISGSPFSGTSLAGKTVEVPGNTFNIRLTSDSSGVLYGFLVTKITPVPLEVSGLVLDTQECNLDTNDSYQLRVEAKATDGTSANVTNNAEYSSSNTAVAEVSATGLITAKGMGNAEISVSYRGISTKVNVSVGVQLSSITLSQGTLNPAFDPNKGDYTVTLPFGTKTVPTITAVAKQSACTVTITPPESLPGTAEITVVSPDNSAQSKYTVYIEAEEFLQSSHPYENNMNKTWTYTEPDLFGKLQITFSADTQLEYYGDYIYITDGSGKGITGSPFTGTSLAGKTVEIPDNTFNIKLTSDSSETYYGFLITKITPVPYVISEITSNVQKCSVDLGDSHQLSINAKATDGTSFNVTNSADYTSSNTAIAEVSETGLITANGYGTATITASAYNKTVDIIVSVLPTLSNISTPIGSLIPEFNNDINEYTVLLPFGTTSVPNLYATPSDLNTSINIQKADSLFKKTNINVIAPDKVTTNTYSVGFEVSDCLESLHPYTSNCNTVWTYTSKTSVGPIALTFSTDTYVEKGYDFIYIMDKNGNNIAGSPFTGDSLSGKTVYVPGDTVVIRLKSDNYRNYYGFKVESIEEPNLSINDDFLVGSILLNDIYGGDVNYLPNIGVINISTQIKNVTNENKKLKVFVASYDINNCLIGIKCYEQDIIADNLYDFCDQVVINNSVNNIKLFIFNGDTLEPVILPVVRSKP